MPVKGRVDKAVLGVRPEDCALTTAAKGDLKGEIFTNELIGDHTLITVKMSGGMLTVKAAKDYTGKTGEVVGIALQKSGLYVFEQDGGKRV